MNPAEKGFIYRCGAREALSLVARRAQAGALFSWIRNSSVV
jgi:hypothetical protein